MAQDPQAPIGEDDLNALVDGRLDPARRAAVESHLAAHPADADRVAAYAAQRDALRAALAFRAAQPIPPRLRLGHLRALRRRAARRRWRIAAAASVLLMLGGGLGWTLRGSLPPAPPLAAEPAAIPRPAAPAAELEARAGGADPGAWLAARLGEPFDPPDLAAFGLALERVRLLPGADGPGALLLYTDPDGAAVSLVRRPAADPAPRELRCADLPGGLLVYTWSDGRRLHLVTAAMPRDRLRPIAQFLERALDAPPPPAALVAGLPRRPCDAALG